MIYIYSMYTVYISWYNLNLNDICVLYISSYNLNGIWLIYGIYMVYISWYNLDDNRYIYNS